MAPAACLDEQVLAAWASGRLPLAEARAVQAHLDACPDCRLMADVLGSARAAPPGEPWNLRPGEQVGPYEVREWLGAGGMGTVFAAFDARLGRRVALKILDASRLEPESRAGAFTRLKHEAQAMAQLNHPNVASIYDVGEREGVPYLAMELLPGGTLRAWLAAGPRTQEEVLRVFVAAARGLAHAHQAGLVHRDFKPDNVLLAHDGTPRITDFGLATFDRGGTLPPAPAMGPPPLDASFDLSLSGTVAGTPGYLAPEVLRGERATALSDQYSFGLALRGALGHCARVRDPAGRLKAVIDRLTAASPSARFASMAQAAQALERLVEHRGARRRLWVGAGVAAAATALLGAVAAAPSRPCAVDGAAAARVRAEVAARLPAALAAVDPGPGGLARAVIDEVSAQLRRWGEVARQSCQAQGDAALQDATGRCLAENLRAVEALLHGYEARPPATVEDALDRLFWLPPPEVCRELGAAGSAQWAEGPAAARRAQLAARLTLLAEEPSAPVPEVDALLGELDPERDGVLYAQALALKAKLSWTDYYQCTPGVLTLLQQVVGAAQRARHLGLAADTWNELARCHRARGELRQGYFSASMGEQLARELPPHSLARLRFSLTRIWRLIAVGYRDEAHQLSEATREQIERNLPEDHFLRALALVRKADVHMIRGELAGALETYPVAIAALERTLGPGAREAARARHNHASVLADAHRYEEAAERFEALAEESRRRTGALSRALASDLSPVYLALGRNEEALRLGRASVQDVGVKEQRVLASMGQELHAWVQAELAAGDPAVVLERLRAIRGQEGVGDGGEADEVERRTFEAKALVALGRAEQALELLDDAAARLQRKTRRRELGGHLLAEARVEALVDLGRLEEAAAVLPELPLEVSRGLDPLRRAEAWLEVARALHRAGRGEESLRLRKQLLPLLVSLGPRAAPTLERAAGPRLEGLR